MIYELPDRLKFPAVFCLDKLGEHSKIMFGRLFDKTSLIILCSANLFCISAWSASIEGAEIELLHTTDVSELHEGCSSDSYKIEISQSMSNNLVLLESETKCPDEYNNYGTINGIIFGDNQLLCDNGYPNDGICSSYVSTGVQEGYYNLGLNSNTFNEPTNDTCGSKYSDITIPYLAIDVCIDTRTKVYLNWDGVDITGTSAEFCYYNDVLYAPTTAPTNIPQGYKFLGWRPKQQ